MAGSWARACTHVLGTVLPTGTQGHAKGWAAPQLLSWAPTAGCRHPLRNCTAACALFTPGWLGWTLKTCEFESQSSKTLKAQVSHERPSILKDRDSLGVCHCCPCISKDRDSLGACHEYPSIPIYRDSLGVCHCCPSISKDRDSQELPPPCPQCSWLQGLAVGEGSG